MTYQAYDTPLDTVVAIKAVLLPCARPPAPWCRPSQADRADKALAHFLARYPHSAKTISNFHLILLSLTLPNVNVLRGRAKAGRPARVHYCGRGSGYRRLHGPPNSRGRGRWPPRSPFYKGHRWSSPTCLRSACHGPPQPSCRRRCTAPPFSLAVNSRATTSARNSLLVVIRLKVRPPPGRPATPERGHSLRQPEGVCSSALGMCISQSSPCNFTRWHPECP